MRSDIEETAIRVVQHRNMMEHEMAKLVKAIEERYEKEEVLDIKSFIARQEELKELIESHITCNPWLELELETMEKIYGSNP